MSQEKTFEKYRRFLAAHIDSVVKLDALLLLYRSPDKNWDETAVSDALCLSPQSAGKILNELVQSRLLSLSNGKTFRYDPKTEETNEIVKGLHEAYKERRMSVIEWIYAGPLNRIQTFADAFKIKGD